MRRGHWGVCGEVDGKLYKCTRQQPPKKFWRVLDNIERTHHINFTLLRLIIFSLYPPQPVASKFSLPPFPPFPPCYKLHTFLLSTCFQKLRPKTEVRIEPPPLTTCRLIGPKKVLSMVAGWIISTLISRKWRICPLEQGIKQKSLRMILDLPQILFPRTCHAVGSSTVVDVS